jgi:mannose-6-phosphate isomerase-like protein (cupin superfamily)
MSTTADLAPAPRLARLASSPANEQRTVAAREIVVIPAETPHSFTGTADKRLRQINIHLSPRFITAWLDRQEATHDQGG